MPVYVYRNLETGETFEYAQRITESALTEHPETGVPVKRLIQPVGIAFKGSGFYVNDSRKSSGKTKSATDSDSGKSSETKTESKSETKSEAKSDAKPAPKTETKKAESKA